MSESEEHQPTAASTRASRRKVREGLVVSDKMDKTVVVEVEDRVKHAAVRQGHAPYQQAEGARRAERAPASATGS